MDVFGVVGATVSFSFESSVAVLERACPDYRGLHVSLCDLLQAHEDELHGGLPKWRKMASKRRAGCAWRQKAS